MKSLNEANFEENIKNGSWLVQFWAAWCGPCIDTKHLEGFESLNFTVGRVNVEENPDLATQYSIVAVPTYVFFKEGHPVKRLTGLQTTESLQVVVRSQ